MTDPSVPKLNRLYLRYLEDEDSAGFIMAVSEHYMFCTLERLASLGSQVSRRAAMLALSFLSDYSSNAVFGRGMQDEDRAVRLLAENGIREIWRRDGNESQQRQLAAIIRQNNAQCFEVARDNANRLIDQAPWFAEVWNQRAIAYFHLKSYEESANDCQQTLELNPYHFGAAVGMAHCYLELCDGFAALECFQRALRLNPGLEGVRAQVEYLKRSLEGK